MKNSNLSIGLALGVFLGAPHNVAANTLDVQTQQAFAQANVLVVKVPDKLTEKQGLPMVMAYRLKLPANAQGEINVQSLERLCDQSESSAAQIQIDLENQSAENERPDLVRQIFDQANEQALQDVQPSPMRVTAVSRTNWRFYLSFGRDYGFYGYNHRPNEFGYRSHRHLPYYTSHYGFYNRGRVRNFYPSYHHRRHDNHNYYYYWN